MKAVDLARLFILAAIWGASFLFFRVAAGTLNSALPFTLFAFASIYLSASYSVILNAFVPLWGAVFSALWLGERLTIRKSLGLLMGVAGVARVMRFGLPEPAPMLAWASGACILGTLCYALAGIYMRKYAGRLKSQGLATCSLLSAALVFGLLRRPFRGGAG